MRRRVQRTGALFQEPARRAVDREEEGGVEGVGGGGEVGAGDVAGAPVEDEAGMGGGHFWAGRRAERRGEDGRLGAAVWTW